MHRLVLDYLKNNGYDDVDDGLYMARVGSCMISIRYYTKSPAHMIRWAKANDVDLPDTPYYYICRLVGMAYDENYIADDASAVGTLAYLNDKSLSPSTNEAIDIHRSTNDMVDMLNDKSGNVGRFRLADL